MRIQFDSVDFSSKSGPNTFASRLALALAERDHEVITDNKGADVSLVFIEPSGAPLAKKIVQRLDGLWTKPLEFATRNAKIKALYDNADAVVHQSVFDKQFIERHWGGKTVSKTIRNGVKAAPITKFSSPALEQIRSTYNLVFSCSANWHRQKRLKENIELFLHARDIAIGTRCCLLVLGANPDHVVADRDIFYANSVPENVFMEVFSMSDWFIHLAWRDHSPNVVVESLSQATPVIYTSDAGTGELVRGYGIRLNELAENDLQPFDYDKPPPFNVNQLTIEQLLAPPARTQVPDISIDTCVRQYVELFEELVK